MLQCVIFVQSLCNIVRLDMEARSLSPSMSNSGFNSLADVIENSANK